MAHVLAKELREAVLQAAMQGKLTEQLPTDTPVEETLKQIAQEKEKLIKEKKIKKEKPLPEIDEDEVPFDIPESWQWVRLKSVCSKIVDGDHNPPHGIEKSDYLMLSAVNINNGKIVELEKCRFLSKEVFEKENERTNLLKDDVLLTIVGTLGRSCVFNGNGKFCFQRSVAVITTMINPLFLKYYFDNPYVQNYMNKNSTGTAQKGFYLDRLNSLLLTLPPIEEQARIVAKVDELMAKIDEYEKLENQLVHLKEQFPKDMKDSLLQAGMMGKLTEQLSTDTPIEDTLKQIAKEKEKLIKEKKIKKEKPLPEIDEDEMPFDIPNNWLWAELQNITKVINAGGDKPKVFSKEKNDICNYPVYSNGEKNDGLFGYSNENRIQEKSITISGRGTIGFTRVREANYTPIVRLLVLTFIENTINLEYLQIALTVLMENGEGTAVKQLTVPMIVDKLIPVPPIEEQARIVAKLDQLLPLVESLEVN